MYSLKANSGSDGQIVASLVVSIVIANVDLLPVVWQVGNKRLAKRLSI